MSELKPQKEFDETMALRKMLKESIGYARNMSLLKSLENKLSSYADLPKFIFGGKVERIKRRVRQLKYYEKYPEKYPNQVL